MMRPDLIAALHAAPARGVLAVTGGGSESLSRLLTTPGASQTVLEAIVPYSYESLADWLGAAPEQACSEAAAQTIAARAWRRAVELAGQADPDLFGLGLTASLATSRPKRGEHRAHVAVHSAGRTLRVTLRLEKGRRTRDEEEQVVAHAAIATLATVAGVHELDLSRTPPGTDAEVDDFSAPAAWRELALDERPAVPLNGAPPPGDAAVCLLPGSFNPVHEGHREMARLAAERTGMPVVYELATTNVEKPPLDHLTVRDRVASLGEAPVWLTRTPRFVEKARLAPGVTFAVGADTITRIGDPRYYRDSPHRRDAALEEVAALGTRFLVFGRTEEGDFRSLDDLSLPDALRRLCDGVSEERFRRDVSSTELRLASD